ncbi:MAG: hypothetical protein FWD72_05875 [Eggerthellaceae bacterium]|nr:hypothetical protein [Eggerthellaceae bacterium]
MKKRTLQGIIVLLGVLLVSVLLASCTGSGNNAASGGTDVGASASTGGTVYAGLPLTISSNGNSYTIKDINITTNDSGNTVLTCASTGFDVLPMRNGSIVIPVYCSIIANGVETEFVSSSSGATSIDFIFDQKLDPDTVVFYPQDNQSNRTEIPIK